MLWLDEFHVIPKTVASVFEHVRLYNFFLLASNDPLVVPEGGGKLALAPYSQDELAKTYALETKFVGDRDYILDKLGHYPVNTDLKPVCEYSIGLQLIEALSKR